MATLCAASDADEIRREDVEQMLARRGVTCFVGPFTAKIGDTLYTTVTSYGVKAEGDPIRPARGDLLSVSDARGCFYRHVLELTKGHTQLAWRRFPAMECADGGYFVTARCAALGTKKD